MTQSMPLLNTSLEALLEKSKLYCIISQFVLQLTRPPIEQKIILFNNTMNFHWYS